MISFFHKYGVLSFYEMDKAQKFVDTLYRNKLLNSYKFESETHKLENGIIRAKSNSRTSKKSKEQTKD